jgi:hypothetical protein
MSKQESPDSSDGSENETVYVYTLEDPRTDEVRYVGATVNPKSRLGTIKNQPHSKRLKKWINGLKDDGEDPVMTVQRETDQEHAEQVENELICEYEEKYALLNANEAAPYPEHRDGYERRSQTAISVSPKTANELHEMRGNGEGYEDVVRRLLEDAKWMNEYR